MGLNENISREGLIQSMQDVHRFQFLFLRNLAEPILDKLGAEGEVALRNALHKYGEWRGRYIRERPETVVEGRDALSLVRNWDSGDLAIAGRIEGDPSQAKVTLANVPGWEYLDEHGRLDLAELYYQSVYPGIAAGYDEAAGVNLPPEPPTPRSEWQVTWTYRGATDVSPPEPRQDIFHRPAEAIALLRRTSQNNGALYMYIAREIIEQFDAMGELLIREGVRGIGRERGTILRERHKAQGLPLNLKTLMDDWDGPLVSVWQWKDQGYLSEGTWHQDCTYCPYADVWAEEGEEGLALGYLYDLEMHTTMYQTYHPGAVVQWEQLKTRGDPVCKFRFSIPDLANPEDPKFQPRSGRPSGIPGMPHIPQT